MIPLFFNRTDKPTLLTAASDIAAAKLLAGAVDLPQGAKIVGGYSDRKQHGALVISAGGSTMLAREGTIRPVELPADIRETLIAAKVLPTDADVARRQLASERQAFAAEREQMKQKYQDATSALATAFVRGVGR